MIEVLDLFAGAGGFSVGAHKVAGDVVGIELDGDAVATHTAANMVCYRRDITTMDPLGIERTDLNAHLHLHASPPCQTFSAAGRGAGRAHLHALCEAARETLVNGYTMTDLDGIPEGSLLVLEPLRWIQLLQPDSVSLEQVRSVLPIWHAYAEGLEKMGYNVWVGLLEAEQYGVPQTRTRAWLGASRHHEVHPPQPTHSRYHVRKPERLDPGVLPWVSMADALGPCGRTGFPRRADNDDSIVVEGVAYRARDLRADDQPAFVVTEKARSWQHFEATPATTIQGDSRVWPRGHKINQADKDRLGEAEAVERYGDRAGTAARRVTVDEAAILQGFPSGFPWQGTKTSQFRQVGNAVPPVVAEAVLRSLL